MLKSKAVFILNVKYLLENYMRYHQNYLIIKVDLETLFDKLKTYTNWLK